MFHDALTHFKGQIEAGKARVRILENFYNPQSVQVVIDSRYYFGEPVNGAKVKYAIYRDRYYFPLWYEPDEESEGPPVQDDNGDSGDQIDEGEGQLDADGKLTIDYESTVSEHKLDYVYRVEARVTAGGEVRGRLDGLNAGWR